MAIDARQCSRNFVDMPWTPPTVVTLANGIRVVCDHVPHVDSCAVSFWVDAGTRDEATGSDGVAHLVEHTAFRRTPTRSMSKISRDFENVGAYVNAYTTKEETCYYVRTLTQHLPRVIATLTDVVLHPVFRDEDVETERSIIVEEIRSYEDEPEEYVFDLGEQQLFGSHPLGMPIVGTVASVHGITADQVRAFHARHYVASRIIVAVSGNITIDRFASLVAEHTRDLAPTKHPRRRTTPPVRIPSEVTLRKPLQQAHVLWQARTVGYHNPDRYALQLINVILGDGMSSRLNVRLREKRGLAYSVYSQVQLFADCGSFSIYAGVDESRMATVHRSIAGILSEIATGGVTASELSRAKAQLRAGKLMALESLSARMSMLGKGLLEDGAPEHPYTTIAALEAVDRQVIERVAASVCHPDTWSRCILLPSAEE